MRLTVALLLDAVVATDTPVSADTQPAPIKVDGARGPLNSYRWWDENKSIIIGDDETRKTRCGWQLNDMNPTLHNQQPVCHADWTEICQQLKSKLSDPSWRSNDIVSLDWLRNHCGTICHTFTNLTACNNYESSSHTCSWLAFDSSSGVCETRALENSHVDYALGQQRFGRDRDLYFAFILQHDYFRRLCGQIGFRNKDSCERRGDPCMWMEPVKPAKAGECIPSVPLILGSFAPELAEFFAPDVFCQNIREETECQTVHLKKDLSLKTFRIISDSVWRYYLAIASVFLSIFLMLKCCKLPPPPVLPARRRALSNIAS